jgi:hypothetical protein
MDFAAAAANERITGRTTTFAHLIRRSEFREKNFIVLIQWRTIPLRSICAPLRSAARRYAQWQ